MKTANDTKPFGSGINPWLFVPLLYFMQAIPVTMVQDVSSLIYKTLGVENEPITRWTSLVALPWSIQFLLGPIVDLNSTKRKWVVNGQLIIAALMAIVPFVFQMPHAFELSLGVFFLTAIFSTLCNIATDGYYLLTMSRDDQAKFAGVLTTSARMGSLFFQGVLVNIAGRLADGGMKQSLAWSVVLLAGAGVYGCGAIVARNTLPRPQQDIENPSEPGETQRNVVRTLLVAGMALCSYFSLGAAWRLIANLIASTNPTKLQGWMLTGKASFLGFESPLDAQTGEIAQLLICLPLAAVAFIAARKTIVGTRTGEAFMSFFRQSKIVPILLFLMFYRFGEAMVVKMAPLFLKDTIAKGGMNLSVAEIGTIKGMVGIFGIVFGGLLGGWVVSRYGLRRSFWTLAILMHLPNLLYLWAATTHPPVWTIYFVHFSEQFGYGFGYAGYMIYQMFIAQRGQYPTTHYAIGVGLGALFINVAGVSSGIIQSNFGYTGFFLSVIFLSLPGLFTLMFIPLEDRNGAPIEAA